MMQRSFIRSIVNQRYAKIEVTSFTRRFSGTHTDAVYDPGTKILPTSQLLFDIFFYGVCCKSKILTQKIPAAAANNEFLRSYLLEPIFKHFIFRKFAGGETLQECLASAKRLQSQWGANNNSSGSSSLNFIIDEAAEDLEGESAFDQSLKGKLTLLSAISTSNSTSNAQIGYIPLKCSSLFPGECLELLTVLLSSHEKETRQKDPTVSWKQLTLKQEVAISKETKAQEEQRLFALFEQVDAMFSDKHRVAKGSFVRGISRIEAILTATQATHQSTSIGVSILLDAEMSQRQPGIDCLYRYLALRHNRTVPVIFNTYQCYLKRAESALLDDLVFCQRHNIFAGVKLVRGAYLFSERQQARDTPGDTPGDTAEDSLWHNKVQVDVNYDTIAKRLVSLVPPLSPNNDDSVKLKLMFATHNRRSVSQIAAHFTHNLGLSPNHPNIAYAQILGMADMLTIALSQGHLLRHTSETCHSETQPASADTEEKAFQVSKLLLYGEVKTLLPWLLRRLQENQDVFGAMQEQELTLLKRIFLKRFERIHIF